MSDTAPDPSEFDEAYYLSTHADVAAAVGSGHFSSGWAHFLACGKKEGRPGASTRTAALAAEVARLNPATVAGRRFAEELRRTAAPPEPSPGATASNPLLAFFERRVEGPGIWKWRHYFDLYHRHLARFQGRSPHVLEIGVYSGGSLDMWQDYFGTGARIYGVDLEPACTTYARENVAIFTGDQADRAFWARFRKEAPQLDVVIDDGGHVFRQQAVTLEELLPHLRPGGVYICEDIHGENHEFGAYVAGLANTLNAGDVQNDVVDPERRLFSRATPWQSAIASITHYPMMVVIEKQAVPVAEFVAPKHGTLWQPHLA